MFALDRSLHHVEATERDIVAIFRSAAAVTVSPPGAKAMSSEAFICVVRKDEASQVYVALAQPGNRKAMIFSGANDSPAGESEDNLVSDALKFTGSMGFTMDPVNLEYGRALREVVVRSIRVICDSQTHHDPALEKRASVVPAAQLPASKDAAGNAGKRTEKAAENKTESGAVHKKVVTGEPTDAKKEVKAKKVGREEVERERLLAEKRAAETWAEEQANIARKALLEVEAERQQRQELLQEKAAAEKRAAEELESARRARELVEAERGERKRILAEKLAAEKRAEEQAEIARCALREAEAERVERDRLAKEKAGAEKRAAEALEAERRAREMIENERIEQEKITAEIAAVERIAVESAATEKIAVDNAERNRLAAEAELTERLEKIKAARAILEKAEADRSTSQVLLADKREAEELALATAEAARLAWLEVEAELGVVENELNALTSTEKALAKQVEAERASWQKAEAERVEKERLLTEKATQKKIAEKNVEAALAALEKVEAERRTLEATLADKTSAELGASKRIESAHAAWEKAEAARIDLERRHGRKAECQAVALERAEAARIALETAVAERVERERLLEDALKAESVAKDLVEAGVRAADDVVNAEKETEPGDAGDPPPPERMEAREPVKPQPGKSDPETVLQENTAVGSAGIDAAKAAAAIDVTAWGDRDAACQAPVKAVNENPDHIPGRIEQVSAGEAAIQESVRRLLEMNPTTSHTEDSVAVGAERHTAAESSSAMHAGSPFFESGESTPAVGFAIDSSLSAIDFHEERQIRYLHQSLNSVRLTIGAYPSQNCVACLCAIESKGTFSVFFGLHLNESRNNIVYTAERKPETIEECAQFIEHGICFAETVGFMMDPVPLDNGSVERIIAAIPVLNRSEPLSR